MEISVYQRIWGTKKNQIKSRGYFPTPTPQKVIHNANVSTYNTDKLTNYELQKSFQNILNAQK